MEIERLLEPCASSSAARDIGLSGRNLRFVETSVNALWVVNEVGLAPAAHAIRWKTKPEPVATPAESGSLASNLCLMRLAKTAH